MSQPPKYCAQCASALTQRQVEGRRLPYCPGCQVPIYRDPKVAALLFIEAAGKVLLTRRAVDPGRGLWALPAGFVDYGEAPEAAAIREAREETGLDVAITRLLSVYTYHGAALTVIAIAYAAQVRAGKAQAGDDADALGWFRRDELPPLAEFPSVELLERWRAGEVPLA